MTTTNLQLKPGDHRLRPNTEDKRWAKYVTEGEPAECWEWRGYRDRDGYGHFTLHRQGQTGAHRAALIRAGVDIPPGMFVLHRCDNPPCVNPSHLYIGDAAQNTRDRVERGHARGNTSLGEKHPTSKYSDAEVDSWRVRAAAGESLVSIARSSGASASNVCRVVAGTSRKKPTT